MSQFNPTNFGKFKEKFLETFDSNLRIAIDLFILKFENKANPLNAEFKENLDENDGDSYDSEKGTLGRVFYFPEFDIFVRFNGRTSSYSGDEWLDMEEVKPKTIKNVVYE